MCTFNNNYKKITYTGRYTGCCRPLGSAKSKNKTGKLYKTKGTIIIYWLIIFRYIVFSIIRGLNCTEVQARL